MQIKVYKDKKGTTCDRCGKKIKTVYVIKDDNNKEIKLGSSCIWKYLKENKISINEEELKEKQDLISKLENAILIYYNDYVLISYYGKDSFNNIPKADVLELKTLEQEGFDIKNILENLEHAKYFKTNDYVKELVDMVIKKHKELFQ